MDGFRSSLRCPVESRLEREGGEAVGVGLEAGSVLRRWSLPHSTPLSFLLCLTRIYKAFSSACSHQCCLPSHRGIRGPVYHHHPDPTAPGPPTASFPTHAASLHPKLPGWEPGYCRLVIANWWSAGHCWAMRSERLATAALGRSCQLPCRFLVPLLTLPIHGFSPLGCLWTSPPLRSLFTLFCALRKAAVGSEHRLDSNAALPRAPPETRDRSCSETPFLHLRAQGPGSRRSLPGELLA